MKIPTYQRSAVIPAAPRGVPNAEPDMFGAQIGKAMQGLGKSVASALGSIGGDLQENQNKADSTEATIQLSNFETQLQNDIIKYQTETPPERYNEVPGMVRQRAVELGQEYMPRIPQSRQREATAHMLRFGNRADVAATGWAAKHGSEYWVARIDQHSSELQRSVHQSAGANVEEARLRIQEIIKNAPHIQEWQKPELVARNWRILYESGLQGIRDKLYPSNPLDAPIGADRDQLIMRAEDLKNRLQTLPVPRAVPAEIPGARPGGAAPGVRPGATFRGPGDAAAVTAAAQRLGISPRDLVAVMSFETGGTLDPSKRGGVNRDGTGRGSFLGLIQFNTDNQAKYGVRPGMTFEQQMGAVEAYLKDRGVRPGDTLAHVYSAINYGRARDHTGQPALWAKDANGSIRRHVERIERDHYSVADRFLAQATVGEPSPGPLERPSQRRVASVSPEYAATGRGASDAPSPAASTPSGQQPVAARGTRPMTPLSTFDVTPGEKPPAIVGARADSVRPEVRKAIEAAGRLIGAEKVEISSGARSPFVNSRGDEPRHGGGWAADLAIIKDGRKLDIRNPDDLRLIALFAEEARARGMTGIGAGNGQPGNYMGPNHVHVGSGRGAAVAWGHGGRSANAPQWLIEAYARGSRRAPVADLD